MNKHAKEDERAFTHGSSTATSDLASDPDGSIEEARTFKGPASRRVTPLEDGEKHDHMAKREEGLAEDRQEALLDEALEETFPGSDPISPKHIT